MTHLPEAANLADTKTLDSAEIGLGPVDQAGGFEGELDARELFQWLGDTLGDGGFTRAHACEALRDHPSVFRGSRSWSRASLLVRSV